MPALRRAALLARRADPVTDAASAPLRRSVGAPPGRRAHGMAREQSIVAAAADLFAEIGLEATTRDLAARLGITQPLLYRYFDNKEALIDRVLDDAFAGDWRPEWGALLDDRAIPLRERLVSFYVAYSEEVLTYRRVRLLMFSGLKGLARSRRVVESLRGQVLQRVLAESRHAFSLPAASAGCARDLETVWNLHDAVISLAMRRHVFGLLEPGDLRAAIVDKVDAFIGGAPALMARHSTSVPDAADDSSSWAVESLTTGGSVWASPSPVEVPAIVATGELSAAILQKSEPSRLRPLD
ncbi:TetR/AcrR family transcriptional regulator [Roseomonas sp. KE2513]|uniref:TetR/AcrR family transcriptional regulator n=1 Tax=Roseomonas sp. KE2513 TaxID=2479202 RepID=UPI0018DF07A0|nr:TetR/AcrR family transcriptional regulator [Roseomonas sp. KE2513]